MKTAVCLAVAFSILLVGAPTAGAATNPSICRILKGPMGTMIPSVSQMAEAVRRLDKPGILGGFESPEREVMDKMIASGRDLVIAMDAYIAAAEDAHYALTICAR